MTTLQKVFAVALAIFVVVVGVVCLKKTPQPVDVDELVSQVTDRIGAVPGPDIFSDYINLNGVVLAPRQQKMRTSTTTICALRSPTTATSTLISASASFIVSSSSATTVEFAKGTTAYSTSTRLGTTYAIAAAAKATIVASTTPTLGDPTIFAPGEWLVVDMRDWSLPTNTVSPTGYCHGIFVINE